MPLPYPLERAAFAALVMFTLAPVVFQGVWRPLADALGAGGDTGRLTYAALIVAGAAILAHRAVWQRLAPGSLLHLLPGAAAALVAGALGLLTGGAVGAAALVAIALSSAVLLPWLIGRLPVGLDGAAIRNKGGAALLVAIGLLMVHTTARLSVFMGDAARAELSMIPDIPFLVHHSCLTAYVEGARLASAGVENLYDAQYWPDLNGQGREHPEIGPYAPFNLDAFAYPPPFLLFMRLSWLGGFAAQRAAWFAINGLIIAVGLWIVADWIGGRAGARALLAAPIVWLASPTLLTLQVGNVHAAVMVAAMLALVAFETRRPVLGGALLAATILAKISPGVLILVLLRQGRFREVAWTAAAGVAFTLAGLLAFGPAPFLAFVQYQLPRLSSGEALTFLTGPESVPINLSPFGIPFKLAALGVRVDDPWAAARGLSSAFTAGLVALALIGTKRRAHPRATAEVWAALLTLSSLRSPLAPGYITFALIWLLSLQAVEVRSAARLLGLTAFWVVLTLFPPLQGRELLIYSMFQQAVVLAAAAWYLLRPPPPEV